MGHHFFHVDQMGRIGAQVVGETLLVANIGKDSVENACGGVFGHGYGEATLEHVLEQAHGFEANRFATGIGARDDEQPLATLEANIERNDFCASHFERTLQERMTGGAPIDGAV